MNTWETLVASALVGTDRQSPTLDTTHPALVDYSGTLQNLSAAQQILSGAALVANYQAVGKSPVFKGTSLLPPAEPDLLVCCSEATTRYLGLVLTENQYEAILTELLQLLGKSQQTVPADFLPLLLNKCQRYEDLYSLILPILSSRGQWLLRQNPAWEYATGSMDNRLELPQIQKTWEIGTSNDRAIALRQWRQLDPKQARQALINSWKKEKAADRATWLEILETGLSLDDEEFLEQALVNKREDIRDVAITLLSQIPSQYCQKLTKLAQECLIIKELNGQYEITIQLPKEDSKEWQIAGISETLIDENSINGLSLAECYVIQAISVASLDVWPGDIQQLVLAMTKTKHSIVVITAWARAACQQKRQAWIESLLLHSYSILTVSDIDDLLQSLPVNSKDQKEQFFISVLTSEKFIGTFRRTLNLMSDYHKNCSLELSSLVLKKINEHTQSLKLSPDYQYRIQDLLPDLSRNMNVDVLPEIRQMEATSAMKNISYSRYIEILEFRRDMQATFDTT
jgi:Family of unknown function (DUF5691)